jgi:hypothetical protein
MGGGGGGGRTGGPLRDGRSAASAEPAASAKAATERATFFISTSQIKFIKTRSSARAQLSGSVIEAILLPLSRDPIHQQAPRTVNEIRRPIRPPVKIELGCCKEDTIEPDYWAKKPGYELFTNTPFHDVQTRGGSSRKICA